MKEKSEEEKHRRIQIPKECDSTVVVVLCAKPREWNEKMRGLSSSYKMRQENRLKRREIFCNHEEKKIKEQSSQVIFSFFSAVFIFFFFVLVPSGDGE